MSIFGHTTTRNRLKYNTGTEEPEEMILNEDHVATGFANFWRKLTGSHLTTADIEANQFSAQQAELAFDREVEFYEKYQSIGAQVQQMRDAGINPFGAAGVSSGNGVRSASPSSVSPSSGSLGFNPLDFVLGIFNMRNQKRLTDAEVSLKNAEANRINQETPFSVQKLISEIASIDTSAQLDAANIHKVIEETENVVQSRQNLAAELNLTYDKAENLQAATQKLISEFERIDSLKDYEVRSASARSAVDEFDASVARIVNELGGSEAGVAVKGFEKLGSILLKYLLSRK